MPTNALSPTWMNNTLDQQFGQLKTLGFTAEGVNRIFQSKSRNETNFTKAAEIICSNAGLITAIRASCPGITPQNLENILRSTGDDCALSIEKLHGCRKTIADLMEKGKFSGANLSGLIGGSMGIVSKGLDALVHHKKDLQSLIDNGFSASNISSILKGGGKKLSESIELLMNSRGNFERLKEIGFSASNISTILNGSGTKLSQNIQVLLEQSGCLFDSFKSGQCSLADLRNQLRRHVSITSESSQYVPLMAQTAEDVLTDDHQDSSPDGFMNDLAALLLLGPNCMEDQLLSGTEALVHHRATLLQLKQVCGFSANHIAGMLKGSEADIGTAIGELSRKKVLLFGLIQEGLFTADELANRLHGSGVHLGEVFEKHPDIRLALHASYRDMMSLAPANKRPRFA